MIRKNEYLKLKAIEILNEKIESQIITLGEVIPETKLKTFNGDVIKLSDRSQKNHVLLSFMRASWCPYCRGQMEMLNGMARTFKKIGCEMIAITREKPKESTFSSEEIMLVSDLTNEFGKSLNMTYFAMEEMKKIYKDLGLTEEVEGYFDTSELNVPATFILTQGEGRIVYKHAKRDYTKRAPGSEIISELSKLNQ